MPRRPVRSPLRCIVIKKEQWFRTGDHDVVDTHGHQVDTDAVVNVCLDGQLELGADTVGAGYQYRLAVTIQRQFKQGTKTAQACQYAGPPGPGDRGLDPFDQLAAGLDIHTGVAVAQGGAGWTGLFFYAHAELL